MTSDTARFDGPLRAAGPWHATVRFWQRTLVFSGRASISEFWWPVLTISVALIVGLVLVGALLGVGSALRDADSPADAVANSLAGVVGMVLILGSLAATVAGVAVTVRRLHDANLSGWLALTSLIPSVGGLVVLVLSLLPANPEGRRYDHGAWPTTDWTGQPQLHPAPLSTQEAASASPFDVWPAPDARTAAAPVIDVVPPADAAIRDAWAAVGAVRDVEPGMTAPPAWRRQGYLAVERQGAPDLLSTDGLHAAALGAGAELYVIGEDLALDTADRWEFALLASVAGRVRAGGMHLPSELEQYGTLSMTVPGVPAPAGWSRDDGTVGVLLGLPFPAAPDAVATASGEVELVCVTPLRPAELQQILDGGAAARAQIAGRLAAMPSSALAGRA